MDTAGEKKSVIADPADAAAYAEYDHYQQMEQRLQVIAEQLQLLQKQVANVRLDKHPHRQLPWRLWIRHTIKTVLGLHMQIGRLEFDDTPRALVVPKRYHRKPVLVNPPVISIATPSFNQGQFLEQTIRSVLSQDYPRLEYVVQDGGSTDSTQQVLDWYRDKLHRCESRKDNGQSQAINLGFAGTTGEIMAYLNSDDLLLPGALHAVADYFQKNPDVDVVYGHRVVIDKVGYELGRWVLPNHDDEMLKWADYVPQETLFWRRRMWDKVGGIDESFRFAMDWDLLLRFQAAGAKMVRLPRFLGAFRVHQSSKTVSTVTSTGFEEMERLRRRVHGGNVTFLDIRAGLRRYHAAHVFHNRMYRLGLFRY